MGDRAQRSTEEEMEENVSEKEENTEEKESPKPRRQKIVFTSERDTQSNVSSFFHTKHVCTYTCYCFQTPTKMMERKLF